MPASPSVAWRRAAPPIERPRSKKRCNLSGSVLRAERPLLALESVSEASSPGAATHGCARGGVRILVGTRSHAEQ